MVDDIGKGVRKKWALSFIGYLETHCYDGKMCVSNMECKDIENAFISGDWAKLGRYFKQKPVEWNEEDEEILESIKDDCSGTEKEIYAKLDFLDSLKPQSHWKPTMEQIKVLHEAIHGDILQWRQIQVLRELYDNLKKLQNE